MTAFLSGFLPALREGARLSLDQRRAADHNRWEAQAAAAEQRRLDLADERLQSEQLEKALDEMREAEQDDANREALLDTAIGAGMRPEEHIARHFQPGGADVVRLRAIVDSVQARRAKNLDLQKKQKAIDDRLSQIDEFREKHPNVLSDMEWSQAIAREERGEKVFDFGTYRFNNATGQMQQVGVGTAAAPKKGDGGLGNNVKAIDAEIAALKPSIDQDEEALSDYLSVPRNERPKVQERLNANRQKVQALLRQKAALYRSAAAAQQGQREAGLGGPPLPVEEPAPARAGGVTVLEEIGNEAAKYAGTKNKNVQDAARRSDQQQAIRHVTDEVLNDPKFKDADDAVVAAEVRRRLGVR